MKLLSLFSGIGAFEKALENIGINVELIGFSEIDKYAIKSYCAIHNVPENLNLGDITKVDISKLPKDIDMITHGSPCQDFSIAGKQAGGDLGTGTRSSLMWNTINIVTYVKPKYVVWENVKNLLSKKHRHNFDNYLNILESLGYNNYYKVLNAKDYGIPQNRERVYTISIRKDVDKGSFVFPEKEELKLKLKDMLESEVEEKFYIKKNFVLNNIISNNTNVIGNLQIDKWQDFMKRIYDIDTYAPTISTMQGGDTEPKILIHNIKQKVKKRKYNVDTEKLVKVLRESKRKMKLTNKEIAERLHVNIPKVEHWFRTDNSFAIPSEDIWYKLKELLDINSNEFDKSIITFEEKEGIYEKADRIYDEKGLAPTLTQQQEKILIRNGTKKGYLEAERGDSVNLSYPKSNTRRGRVGKQVSQTLQCNDMMGVVTSQMRIRKLTPLECWRLMGFSSSDFYKAKNVGNSNAQLYKQAGNSIVVNVLEKIFKNLLGD